VAKGQASVTGLGGESIQTQVGLLGARQLPHVQRKAVALQIERTQGNRHLQKVVAALRSDELAAASRTRLSLTSAHVVQRGGRRRRRRPSSRLSPARKRLCESAKALTEDLYRSYGFKTNMPNLVTSLAWRKRWYKFYWRVQYNTVWRTAKKGGVMYTSTFNNLYRFKQTIARHERHINYLIKNRGYRSPKGHEKEAKLKRYGYKFKYLRTYRPGVGRCTITDPKGKVLFYEITRDQVEQALNWLLVQAAIKGYALQKAAPAHGKRLFDYKQVARQAKQAYRRLSNILKRARFDDFKRMLALAKVIDLQWESNYGLGGIGKYEKKIARSLQMYHQRGHRGWALIKLVWKRHALDCWQLAAYRWALRFGTGGKWAK
jgi:hypothetical protein